MISHVPGSPWMFGALFGASLYVSATAFAAEPVEMSRHLFGDSGSDNFGCALELANGDLLLAGTSRDAVTDDPDILVVRTDAQGATLWQQKFGQPGRVERTRQKECLAPTPDGHFVVGMEINPGPNGARDAGITKFDGSGNILWETVHGGSGHDQATQVSIAADGDIYLAGLTFSFGAAFNDMWVSKLDQAGNVLWSQIYGGACGATYEAGWNLQSTSDGGFIIAGTGGGTASFYKADADGNLEWSACDFNGQVRDIDATDDGGFIVTGLLSGTDGDAVLAKYDASLTQEWITSFGDTGYDLGLEVIQTSDGGYAFTGYHLATATAGVGLDDLWFVKTDALGNLEHELIVGSAIGGDQGDKVLELQDGRYAVAGRLFESPGGFGDSDAALVFIDLVGDPAFIEGTVRLDLEGVCTAAGTTALPRPGQWVSVEREGGPEVYRAMTTADGTFSATVPAGDWHVAAEHGPSAQEADTCGTGGLYYDRSLEAGEVSSDNDFWSTPKSACNGEVFSYDYAPADNGYPGCSEGEVQTGACLGYTWGFCSVFTNTGTAPWGVAPFPGRFEIRVPTGDFTINGPGDVVRNTCGASLVSYNTSNITFANNAIFNAGDSCEICLEVETTGIGTMGTSGSHYQSVFWHLSDACGMEYYYDYFHPTMACACDPNDLAAQPEGCGPEQNILAQELTYDLRFQNVGFGSAIDVEVVVDLDPALDPDSLRLLSASHDLTSLQVDDSGQMIARFEDIFLPPEVVDPAGSNGDLHFAISPRMPAADGTAVDVTASIYFDTNLPVVTNTVRRTLYNGDPVPVPDFEVSEQAGVFDFTYTGGTSGVSARWSFGPDASPMDATTLDVDGVTYTTPGPQVAALTVEKNGCAARGAQTVEVPCDAFFETDAFMAPMGNAKQLGATLPVKFQTLRYLGTEVTDAAHLEQILADDFGWTPGDGCWPQLGVIDVTTGERVPLDSGSTSSLGATGPCFTGGAGSWRVNLDLDTAAFTSGHEYQVVAEMYACYGFDALEPGNDTFFVK